jgi:hypothetical protein
MSPAPPRMYRKLPHRLLHRHLNGCTPPRQVGTYIHDCPGQEPAAHHFTDGLRFERGRGSRPPDEPGGSRRFRHHPKGTVGGASDRSSRPPLVVPYPDPLRTSVDRGGPDCPIWPVARQAVSRAETLHRIPACISMHRRDPAKLPGVCRDPPACEVSHTAAKGVKARSILRWCHRPTGLHHWE